MNRVIRIYACLQLITKASERGLWTIAGGNWVLVGGYSTGVLGVTVVKGSPDLHACLGRENSSDLVCSAKAYIIRYIYFVPFSVCLVLF